MVTKEELDYFRNVVTESFESDRRRIAVLEVMIKELTKPVAKPVVKPVTSLDNKYQCVTCGGSVTGLHSVTVMRVGCFCDAKCMFVYEAQERLGTVLDGATFTNQSVNSVIDDLIVIARHWKAKHFAKGK